jgi:hypothetical protein
MTAKYAIGRNIVENEVSGGSREVWAEEEKGTWNMRC